MAVGLYTNFINVLTHCTCSFLYETLKFYRLIVHSGRRPQFRLLAKYIPRTVRTDTDRARYDWLLLMG